MGLYLFPGCFPWVGQGIYRYRMVPGIKGLQNVHGTASHGNVPESQSEVQLACTDGLLENLSSATVICLNSKS